MTSHQTRFNESMRIIRSLGTSFAALVEMRKFAELVVDMIANDSRVSDSLRHAMGRSGLGKSLGVLEDKAPELGIPREIPAALRSLQAYGNYGAHLDPENAWPSKLSVDAAMASAELIYQWIPRWMGTASGEAAGPQAEPIRLRASVRRPGFFQRQWVWFLTPNYPPKNLSIQKSNGTGEKDSIYRYPSEASAGIKRGVLLSFLTNQIDAIRSIVGELIRLECETPVPAREEALLQAIVFLSRERPQKLPDFICQDILTLVRMKEVVSRSSEPEEEALDAIALELSRRAFVGDVARWFAENYLQMNTVEVHGAGWLAKAMFISLSMGLLFAFGRSQKPPAHASPAPASAVVRPAGCPPCEQTPAP